MQPHRALIAQPLQWWLIRSCHTLLPIICLFSCTFNSLLGSLITITGKRWFVAVDFWFTGPTVFPEHGFLVTTLSPAGDHDVEPSTVLIDFVVLLDDPLQRTHFLLFRFNHQQVLLDILLPEILYIVIIGNFLLNLSLLDGFGLKLVLVVQVE